jgi:cubilin
VLLDVVDFEIEQHSTCEFDYLEIFDGVMSENATSLGRYCGDTKPGNFTSSFNHLHVKFASDLTVFGRGFLANYSFVDVQCGGIIKDSREIIKAPLDEDGNGVYKADSLCKWLIYAPVGHVIQINVLQFELESDTQCRYDFIKIFNNGSGNGDQIGPFCGSTIPKVITTNDNIATIVFQSDSSTGKDGFTIGFTFIEGSKCELEINLLNC